MPRILLADDNQDMTSTLARILAGAGHEVEVASNGAECLVLIRDRPRFDLLLLDVKMPDVSGLTVLEQLALGELPVIILTGNSKILGVTLPPCVKHVMIKAAHPREIMEKVDDVLKGA